MEQSRFHGVRARRRKRLATVCKGWTEISCRVRRLNCDTYSYASRAEGRESRLDVIWRRASVEGPTIKRSTDITDVTLLRTSCALLAILSARLRHSSTFSPSGPSASRDADQKRWLQRSIPTTPRNQCAYPARHTVAQAWCAKAPTNEPSFQAQKTVCFRTPHHHPRT